MKAIKITETNRATIAAAIVAAEGRATVRTVSAQDVFDEVTYLDHKLDIPKCHMVGIEARISLHAETFANSYKYIPEGTCITMLYHTGGWYLEKVFRANCNNTRVHTLVLPAAAQEALIGRFERF